MEEKTPFITADESKGKRFHVLVTDAGTGEALVDHETSCVIVSYDSGDSVKTASLSGCSVLTVAGVIVALEKAIASINKTEAVRAAVSFLKLATECAPDEAEDADV